MLTLPLGIVYPVLILQFLIGSVFPLHQYRSQMGAGRSISQPAVQVDSFLAVTSPSLARQFSDSGFDQPPILLQLLVFLFGNDWLGTDWLYLGFVADFGQAMDVDPESLPDSQDTSVEMSGSRFPRFWTDPGPALLKPADTLWVWGFDAGAYNVYADSLLVNPPAGVAPPDEVLVFGKILTVEKGAIDVLDIRGLRYTVLVDEFTEYTLLPGGVVESRPEQGIWLNISWLAGNGGLFGRYARFHGSCRGYLRLDFHCP